METNEKAKPTYRVAPSDCQDSTCSEGVRHRAEIFKAADHPVCPAIRFGGEEPKDLQLARPIGWQLPVMGPRGPEFTEKGFEALYRLRDGRIVHVLFKDGQSKTSGKILDIQQAEEIYGRLRFKVDTLDGRPTFEGLSAPPARTA